MAAATALHQPITCPQVSRLKRGKGPGAEDVAQPAPDRAAGMPTRASFGGNPDIAVSNNNQAAADAEPADHRGRGSEHAASHRPAPPYSGPAC